VSERLEGESLEGYALRIAERHKRAIESQRRDEPRFDLECAALDKLHTLGLENVGDGIISLSGEVTSQHTAMVLELSAVAGSELRVVATNYSQVQVSYADLMRLREGRDSTGVDKATVRAVRQLMVAQRDVAQKWLDANPEPHPDNVAYETFHPGDLP
jgi:hypothetical protein